MMVPRRSIETHRRTMAGRVWIVNHYASTPDRPAGTRHFDLARQLVERGYDVSIFAAGFGHHSGREERLQGASLVRRQEFEGVEFVWLRTVPYRGNTWRRQLNMLSFLAVFLVAQARSRRPDVVIGSSVHPFAALGGWLAARLRGAAFAFEIRDLWPQTLVDLGALRLGSPGERVLRWIEAFLTRRAFAVITLLPGTQAYLATRGLRSDHVVYIPNGVDLSQFDVDREGAGVPREVGCALDAVRRMRRDGRFMFAYTGSLGRVNALQTVIEAARTAEGMAPGRVGIILVGDGPERPMLERMAVGLPGVAFARSVPKRFVPGVLRAVDGTVVHATRTPVYRYGISFNKLFEYMAVGRPVIFACETAYDPVAASHAGFSVPPDDPGALADAMLRLASLPEGELRRMGSAGRDCVAKEHNIACLGDKLATVVAQGCAHGRGHGKGSPATPGSGA